MKLTSSRRLTFQFIAHFIVFYLILVASIVYSIVIFLLIINKEVGLNVHSKVAFEFEGIVENDKLPKELHHLAEENLGQFYLLNDHLDVLDYTGASCEICAYSDEELLGLETQGMQKWQADGYTFLFLYKSLPQEILETVLTMWHPSAPLTDQAKAYLKTQQAAVDVYDKQWDRILTWGASKKSLSKADLLDENYEIFEMKELTQSKKVGDVTVVIRIDNPQYQPFDQPFTKALLTLLVSFVITHVLLIVGVVLFSLSIARKFVHPIIYVIERIQRLASFNYDKPKNTKLYDQSTGKLKRKYRLYEPIDASLDHLSQRLVSNERQIQHVQQLRDEWITGLSHDLKTPLSSILGYSAMLASKDYEWSKEEVQAFAETMEEKANYMDALIQDLTYTYQLKNRAIILTKDTFDVKDLLSVQQSLRVQVEMERDVTVYADPLALKRILDNLLCNALQYTPEEKDVKLHVTETKTHTIFTITDQGEGIPQEKLDNLFERYYRGTNTTTNVTGTGLGLAITKQLIDLHQGEISVKSSNKGTRFTIQLPKNISW
ncbi:sensor histidine kinase [Lysinibacillus sp. LZ02]|uniref:sensor histidine kinase n=1 Tax=Lysinibacillus sp. LZ02 TaxID=3420668 RepID=UPI003D365725